MKLFLFLETNLKISQLEKEPQNKYKKKNQCLYSKQESDQNMNIKRRNVNSRH